MKILHSLGETVTNSSYLLYFSYIELNIIAKMPFTVQFDIHTVPRI